MLTVYVLVDLALGLLVGLAAGRFIVLLVPVAVWAVWGGGQARHWWGNGGEQIFLGTVILIGLGLVAAAVGVAIRRLLVRQVT